MSFDLFLPHVQLNKSDTPTGPVIVMCCFHPSTRSYAHRLYYFHLCGRVLEVGDEGVSLLILLDAREDHLGAGDELLGVLKVGEESLLTPRDTLVHVGSGVGIAGGLASLAAEETAQVGALLVRSTGFDSVACMGGGRREEE